MKKSRRAFIRETGMSALGVSLFSDGFLRGCIGQRDNLPVEVLNKFSHVCEIIRPEDFLCQRYYFVNLTPDRRGRKLVKLNDKEEAYILVRLTQQHIAEEVHPTGDPVAGKPWSLTLPPGAQPTADNANCTVLLPTNPVDLYSKSFISGYSYLSFRLKKSQSVIPYTAEGLLAWDQYDLLTLEDLKEYPKNIPVKLSPDGATGTAGNAYPVRPDSAPTALAVSVVDNFALPVTLIEAPYKLFLTPVKPELRPAADTTYNYLFSGNNLINNYYDRNGLRLSQLWSNDLVLRINGLRSGSHQLPPDFKILAYEEQTAAELQNRATPLPDYDSTIYLLPNPTAAHRSELALLTNLPEHDRDVAASYFTVSSLGVTTYLNYFNLDEKNLRVVGWKQDIALGRDNYVEIIEKAIDSKSTLKLLISIIAERRIEKGKSFLLKRRYFKYLEPDKEFGEPVIINGYPLKKITARAQGSFFSNLYAADDPNLGFGDANHFIPMEECEEKTVIRMPYEGILMDGSVVRFEQDLHIIPKFAAAGASVNNFTQANVENYLRAYHGFVANRAAAGSNEHLIPFDNQKLAYTAPIADAAGDPANQSKNNVLVTHEWQFYSVFNPENTDNSAFESKHPLFPRLLYAVVNIPQLEGIEPQPSMRYVSYSGNYRKAGLNDQLNKAKVFLQVLDESIKKVPLLTANERDTANELLKKASSIRNIFSDNYKNAGALVNPDVVVDNISLLKQGISLTDEISNRVNDLKNIRPADLLRGLNVELIGGVRLLSILKAVVPMEDSPLFHLIDEAAGMPKNLQAQYQQLQNKVTDIPGQISKLQDQLKDALPSGFSTFLDKYYDKLTKGDQLKLLQGDLALPAGAQKLNALAQDWQRQYNQRIHDLVNSLLPVAGVPPDWVAAFTSVQAAMTAIVPHMKNIVVVKQVMDEITGLLNAKAAGDPDPATQALRQLQTYLKQAQVTISWDSYHLNDLEAAFAGFTQAPEKYLHSLQSMVKHELGAVIGVAQALPAEILADLHTAVNGANETLAIFIANNTAVLKSFPSLGITDAGRALVYKIHDNIDGWSNYLAANATRLANAGAQFVKMQVDSVNDWLQNATHYIDAQLDQVNQEIGVLKNQVSFEVTKTFQQYAKSIDSTRQYQQLAAAYQTYQSVYLQFVQQRENAKQLVGLLKAANTLDPAGRLDAWARDLQVFSDGIAAQITGPLKNQIGTTLDRIASTIANPLPNLHQQVDQLKASLVNTALEDTAVYTQNFHQLQSQVKQASDALYGQVDAERKQLLDAIDEQKAQLVAVQSQVKNFVRDTLGGLQQQLDEADKTLMDAYATGKAAVDDAMKTVNEVRDTINQLRSITKKQINYSWNTQQFDDANLGILKFVKGRQAPTELSVNVNTTINFSVENLPPKISSVTTSMDTRLSNFSLDFLSLVTVEFDHVSFAAGSGMASKFDVAIRNVRFDGPLNFVQVFQSFLKTLDKGLRFDISAAGAMLGYELPIPDITGGAFNFTHARLVMELRLPFKAGVPMRFTFGLSSPQELFLISCSIFGGRGCFQLAVEPRNGVVLILLILEFGGVLLLSIGVADGMAYLFAGIYIRKEYDKVELRGYITCGGMLNILGLITASVTFYLGLSGNGKYLEGSCTLQFEIKICAFVHISVGLSMYKRLYGSTDNSQRPEDAEETARMAAARIAPAAREAAERVAAVRTIAPATDNDLKPNGISADVNWQEFFAANFH
ncbi:MAG TPA: hypothetical protein VGM89_12665 [Puia sp.]|jgi:hypothetical protein